MAFLTPALLALVAAVAVPLALHLLHRSQGKRIAFPALRYLLRTEKDHARRIRTRQLVLLAIRCSAIVLAALAAARLVVRGSGAAHPPTAVALIVDNSLSSGRVVGETRVLDELRQAALDVVDQAAPGDLFWVIRVGEPWDLATPLTASEARTRLEDTEVSGAAGDLIPSLERARALLEESPLEIREIHLVSDLQASAFRGREGEDDRVQLGGLPVVVRTGLGADGANRYVRSATVGGGLTPRANRRTEVTVSVGGPPGDSATVPVRVVLGEQLRGAAETPVEGTAVLAVGPFVQGRLEGYAETDPDDLRADDRYYLSVQIAPPPAVATVGDPGPFVQEALGVLESGGRLRRTDVGDADVVFLEWGQGLASLSEGQRAVVLPGPDPALRTAASRRLQEAGAEITLGPGSGAPTTIGADGTGSGLEGVGVRRQRTLQIAAGSSARPRVTLDGGGAWLAEADIPSLSQPLLVVASRLDPAETDIPLEAAMIPLVEWLVSGAGAGVAAARVEAGLPISLPPGATHVEAPAGTRTAVDGSREFRFTGTPGIYSILAEDEILERVAVNAPLRESLLAPLGDQELRRVLADADVVLADGPAEWRNRVFTQRSGREAWPWLVGGALVLLLLESWVASSGGAPARTTRSISDSPRVQDAQQQA